MNKNSIEKASEWLLNSGIRNEDDTFDSRGYSLNGSFNAWYDLKNKEHSYVYLEIVGYGLTTFLYLNQTLKKKEFLDKAISTGEWLIKIQNDGGGFPTALYHSKTVGFKKPEEMHTFDVGMIYNGLANLYKATKRENYLKAAKLAADWAIKYQNEDGSVSALIDKESGLSNDNTDTWSTQPGPYHAKFAIGLLNIYDITKDKRYKNAATKLCDYALTKQNEEGQFYTYGELNGTNFHPHIYTAEGLYVAGKYLDNEKYITSARKAMTWVLEKEVDGVVPRHKHGNSLNYNERVDILSQSLRLSILLDIESEKLDNIYNKVLDYQYFGEVKSQHGGIIFGKMSNGKKAEHPNSWVTMFTIQAFILRERHSLEDIFLLI